MLTNMVLQLSVTFLTNTVPAGQTSNGLNIYDISKATHINQYLPDGTLLNCNGMVHVGFVTSAPPVRSGSQLPIPPRTTTTLFQFSPQLANGGTDNVDNFCLMFKTFFTTNTNQIYGLWMTTNFMAWSPCPPEIDGTGSSEYFFDVLEGARSYRVSARPGVLPTQAGLKNEDKENNAQEDKATRGLAIHTQPR